tara:strand:+ start:165 stop:530 length:366 start_codon:yes stop_codon:yes gene_type:complete
MGFFDFIGKVIRTVTEVVFPRQFIEPEKPEIIKKEYRRKIIKPSGIGSKNFIYKNGVIMPWYALTYEDNDIDRQNFLVDELLKKIPYGTSLDRQTPNFGYDGEETITEPSFIYPESEVNVE